jgi:hypothetical protein
LRSREGQIIGSKRVDEAHDFFQSLLPPSSKASDDLYKNVWNPADFPIVEQEAPKTEAVKEEPSPAE